MIKDFSNKVAVITGGASGIGLSTAEQLAAGGATIVIADIDDTAGENAISSLKNSGEKHLYIHTDVTEESQVSALVHTVHSTFGRIDILLNGAGSPVKRSSFLETTLETWEACFAQNVRGTFLCSREILKYMVSAKQGVIINMASGAAYSGSPNSSVHYGAAKGAITTFTRGIAREFAKDGIRVNALAPGAVDTPFHTNYSPIGFLDKSTQSIPIGRAASSDEIAALIVFLCSDGCPYLTGSTIRVDGGMFV